MTQPSSSDLPELRRNVDYYQSRLTEASTKDDALENAIKAAEAAMSGLKLATDPNDKSQFSANVSRLLKNAEDIKAGKDWRSMGDAANANGSTKVLREPRSTRPLPKSEQILLLKASYLNGLKFPPWMDSPGAEEFDLKEGEALFTDEAELPLSEFQEEVFDDWKRPVDALPPPAWGDQPNSGPSMEPRAKVDLVQDASTDCSVVASLCAGRARVEKGHAQISRAVVHPHDEQTGHPIMSKNGKYILRLNFNGCHRKVVIDDRLPVSKTGRVIHVIDRRNPGLLWPALVEKAYLKVRGGYDFPGSNSGTDLWILTGWIPEQVFLQSDELEPEKFWKRILNAFTYGDVMITMGTGKMTAKTEKELGLAGEHDYAVLELREIDGQRLMLVKNPWCEGTSWRGRFNSSGSSEDLTAAVVSLASEEASVQSSRDLLNADEQLSPGTFWMDLDNVVQHFESVYLNWNPGLFKYRQDLHFAWDLSPSETGRSKLRGRYASLRTQPQFAVRADAGGTIWVLLSRHFRNAISPAATTEEIESGRYDIDLTGHITLAAFSSGGKRVLLPEKQLKMGWYVDSPQTLLTINDCEPGKMYTVVPLEQNLVAAGHTFTMSAFGNTNFQLAEAATRYPCSSTVSSSWTKDTAGGNAHSNRYCTNPQFSITVKQPTRLTLLLEALDDSLNVHVKLVHGQGKRIHAIRSKDIIVDSKDYRRGCCVAEIPELQPGKYTIICSTFEPQQLGDFNLVTESSQPVQVDQLPKEGAGRIRLELAPITFGSGQKKVVAALSPRRLVNFYAIARRIDANQKSPSGTRTPVSNRSLAKMSIEVGPGPERSVLAASAEGEYMDSNEDIRMKEIDMAPDIAKHGGAWLVFDRMYATSEGHDEKFVIELFVDQPDGIACGEWKAIND